LREVGNLVKVKLYEQFFQNYSYYSLTKQRGLEKPDPASAESQLALGGCNVEA
jgi:hypothetical protein